MQALRAGSTVYEFSLTQANLPCEKFESHPMKSVIT